MACGDTLPAQFNIFVVGVVAKPFGPIDLLQHVVMKAF
jgi:hypothetical protein